MHTEPQPVIVGSGLAGSLISLQLSKEHTPHILIGAEPNNQPRFGESLNFLGSLGLFEYASVAGEAMFDKAYVTVTLDGNRYYCPFDISRSRLRRWFVRLIGYHPRPAAYHVDRVILDRKLFDLAIQSRYCRFIPERVTQISADPAADRITQIELADGTQIVPQVVFDATNHFAVIPRSLNINQQRLSDDKRLVFAHFCREDIPPTGAITQPDWQHTTHIFVLKEADDGINAQMWVIPLGRKVSIGVTFDVAYATDLSRDDVLSLAAQAAARRGVDYAPVFPQHIGGIDGTFHYYLYDRAFGANWLMAGPTFVRTFWTTGNGVSTALESALVAPHFIRAPQLYGARYEASLRALLDLHYEHVRRWESFDQQFSHAEILELGDMLGDKNLTQGIRAARLAPRWSQRVIGHVLDFLYPSRWIYVRDFCYLEDGRCLSDFR